MNDPDAVWRAAQLGVLAAAQLRRERHPVAGVVIQLTNLTADFGRLLDRLDVHRGCRGCGGTLTQPATGRPRQWCSERCRQASRRKRPETL